ncbi:hypothetical protein LCGC14_2133510 [marine sediment metagenome]|uniref:HNH nuclease domain-containing protein n=1 Tax=marine sediment metagenome TaxID=412755 RepID=A0A0F9EMU6_9ZZZZ
MGLIERLSCRLKVVPNGCWEWQGCRLKDGYGLIGRGGGKRGMLRVHRAMWEIVFGPIPDGMDVLHRCDNPPCANPTHLWLGTHADNMADMIAKGRCADRAGEKNGNAKLTWEQVKAIRADTRFQRVIAAEYGVVPQLISQIKLGQIWKGEEAWV